METIGFGNGADGVAVLTGTDAPIDSAAVGTAAATSLSATNPSFAAGQIILVIQMQGTNAGKAELNRISSYVAGTITTTRPLAYTYSCTGNDKAQVIVVPQHSKITMSGSFTGKAWDGTVGGIIAKFCNGEATIDQSLLGTGIG